VSTPETVQPPVIDPDAAEDYAESVGIDPTPEQIDRYLEMEGDEPLGEHRE
jgi:hypothetical protein